MMKRREFITLVGGAAAAWPLAARAQQPDRVRRVAVLEAFSENDPEMQERMTAFREDLGKLGWTEGRNLHIDFRFTGGNPDRYAPLARELVALQPDAILTSSAPLTTAVQRETRSIPIVFVTTSDPVGAGLVESLSRPGSNITGFVLFEASVTGKWLALLKEIAPNVKRVALVGNPRTGAFDYYLHAAEANAPSLGLELTPARVATAGDIERKIEDFAQMPDGALLFTTDAMLNANRELIIALANRHRLPAVYALRAYVIAGGLMCYDMDRVEDYRGAAAYIDRILRGAKPNDLPVQAPTKFRTVINLKAAKAIGLNVPSSLLVRADEVIE